MTLSTFLSSSCNSAVIVSFLVFKLLDSLYTDIICPVFIYATDDNNNIINQNLHIGRQKIRYGNFLFYFMMIFSILYIIYLTNSKM
jgi:hypothetical protein